MYGKPFFPFSCKLNLADTVTPSLAPGPYVNILLNIVPSKA